MSGAKRAPSSSVKNATASGRRVREVWHSIEILLGLVGVLVLLVVLVRFVGGPIVRSKTADTPAKRIYLAVQLMYLTGDLSDHNEVYFPLVRDFMEAAPSATPLIAEVNNRILSGDLYKALRSAKKLVAYEQELMGHALRGKRVLESRTDNSVAAGA